MGAKKLTKEQKDQLKIVVGPVRLSHPHFFKPQAPKPTDKPKYSGTFLIPKSMDLAQLKSVIKKAKLFEYGPKENWPDDLVSPIRDGDGKAGKNKDGTPKEGYAGHWVLKATSTAESKPVVCDRERMPIENPSEVYPGCYVQAALFAYAWEYMGKQGIGFILDGVRKVKEGKSLGGKRSAEDMFDPLSGDDDTETESFTEDEEEATF